MRNHNIAIQGSIASFHDLAAKKYFGEDITILECGSFREVCDKLSKNMVDYGIIAIENKVAGSILLNYQLIDLFNLKIIGETYLPIELKLLAKPGTKLEDITEIISHPMALGQCQDYLSNLDNVKVTEFKDTSTSAELILNQKGNTLGVIAGPAVATKYNLEIIENNVCDEKINYTRFYILSKGEDFIDGADKVSLNLVTHNQVGSLSEILIILKNYNLNLTKIQSVPIPNNPNQYAFHLDIEFKSKNDLESALEGVEKIVKSFKVLGIYKGEKISLANPILN
jgi:prephenate dehydratase